jgi:hypothetical protein
MDRKLKRLLDLGHKLAAAVEVERRRLANDVAWESRDVASPQPSGGNEIAVSPRAVPPPGEEAAEAMVFRDGRLRRFDAGADADPHAEIRAFLKSRGVSDRDVEHVCYLLDGRLAEDDPPNAAHGGMPRPGGSMTEFKPAGNADPQTELRARPPGPGANDARRLAMDAAERIIVDRPRPSSPAIEIPDTSERALAEFAARHPDAARIKVN